MPADVIMPNLGLTMEEGLIVRWLAAPGERVERGQPLFEVETDKVSVEVEALAEGVLGPVIVEAGRKVAVGTVLARIGQEDDRRWTVDTESVAGLRSPASDLRSPPTTLQSPISDLRPPTSVSRAFSSPRARKIAKERGIDWRRLSGSGPRGRVIERDVLAAAAPTPRLAASHLAAEVDLSRLLDAHRRLAPFAPELRLVDWLARILAVALDEQQRTPDLSICLADVQPARASQSQPSLPATAPRDHPRTISATALRSLTRIAAERRRDAPFALPPPHAAIFSIYDLSGSRTESFPPSLVAPESGCLVLGPIDRSSRARISLSYDGLLFTAPQALRLLDSVIDLVEEPAGLLLAI